MFMSYTTIIAAPIDRSFIDHLQGIFSVYFLYRFLINASLFSSDQITFLK